MGRVLCRVLVKRVKEESGRRVLQSPPTASPGLSVVARSLGNYLDWNQQFGGSVRSWRFCRGGDLLEL